MGKRILKKQKPYLNFSKKLINDIRYLLWVITVGGLLLAFYCVHKEYTSSLPWITSMVGLPWASHATICSLYLNKSKAENTAADGTGIVFAAAQAKGFMEEYECNKQKYKAQEEESYTNVSSKEQIDNIWNDYFIDSPPI